MKLRAQLIFSLLVSVAAACAHAQFTPPPVAGFVNPGTGWTPLTGSGAGSPVTFNPPPAALYTCAAQSGGVCTSWQPWTGGGGGTGTVTSVALVGSGNLFSSSAGTAVTSSGNLNVDSQLATQADNCIVAGPSTGAVAAPTCRALVNADFPGTLAPTISAANMTSFPAGAYSPYPTVTQISGSNDLMCASAGDTTIGAQTITGGTSTASTMTFTMAAVPKYMFAGMYVGSTGASPSGWNVTGAGSVIASVDATHVTITNATNPGNWTSGGTIYLACGNQSNNAVSATPYLFQTRTLAANFWAAGQTLNVTTEFLVWSSSSATNINFVPRLQHRTAISLANPVVVGNSNSAAGGSLSWIMTALQANLVDTELTGYVFPSTGGGNYFSSQAVQPISVTSSKRSLGREGLLCCSHSRKRPAPVCRSVTR